MVEVEGVWAYIPSSIPREPLFLMLIGLNRDLYKVGGFRSVILLI